MSLLVGTLGLAAEGDPVAARGLKPTTLDRKLVASAVARTNLMLQGSGLRFVPTWSTDKPEKPAKTEKRSKGAKGGKPTKAAKPAKAGSAASDAKSGDVPLYLVDAGADATMLSAVPQGCRCVVVDPAFLASWIDFNSKGPGRLPIDRGYFLSFLLLHEAGHLKDGNAAAQIEHGVASAPNADPAKVMADERHADEFAAEVLRRLGNPAQVDGTTIEVGWVVIELSKLSWNMQNFHSADEFAAFSAGKPGAAFDESYSHANLALRVLTTADLIRRTPGTQQLLQAYEQSRQGSVKPKAMEAVRK